jgi:hypothetical protein
MPSIAHDKLTLNARLIIPCRQGSQQKGQLHRSMMKVEVRCTMIWSGC